MKFSVYLVVILLTICYCTVHSVPIRHVVEKQQPVKVTRKEINPDLENNNDILQVNKFAV